MLPCGSLYRLPAYLGQVMASRRALFKGNAADLAEDVRQDLILKIVKYGNNALLVIFL